MTMSPKQRENLIKAIKANGRMSQESKKKALAKRLPAVPKALSLQSF